LYIELYSVLEIRADQDPHPGKGTALASSRRPSAQLLGYAQDFKLGM